MALPDLIGFAGAGLIGLVYFLNQSGRLDSQRWPYPASNLGGSLLVIVSLCTSFNFPSLVIELFWSAISVYGLVRSVRRR